MPWVSIAIWLFSYFLSSKQEGVSNAEAALLATGAGVASYYAFDPANPDNFFGVGVPDADITGGVGLPTQTGATGTSGSGWSLPSWVMPTAAGVLGASALGKLDWKTLLLLGGAGFAAYKLLFSGSNDSTRTVYVNSGEQPNR